MAYNYNPYASLTSSNYLTNPYSRYGNYKQPTTPKSQNLFYNRGYTGASKNINSIYSNPRYSYSQKKRPYTASYQANSFNNYNSYAKVDNSYNVGDKFPKSTKKTKFPITFSENKNQNKTKQMYSKIDRTQKFYNDNSTTLSKIENDLKTLKQSIGKAEDQLRKQKQDQNVLHDDYKTTNVYNTPERKNRHQRQSIYQNKLSESQFVTADKFQYTPTRQTYGERRATRSRSSKSQLFSMTDYFKKTTPQHSNGSFNNTNYKLSMSGLSQFQPTTPQSQVKNSRYSSVGNTRPKYHDQRTSMQYNTRQSNFSDYKRNATNQFQTSKNILFSKYYGNKNPQEDHQKETPSKKKSNFKQYLTQTPQTKMDKSYMLNALKTPKQFQNNQMKESQYNNQDSYNNKYYTTKLKKFCIQKSSPNSKMSELYQQHYLQTYKSIKDTNQIPQISNSMIDQKAVYLPKCNRRVKKTLVFDLDETLIHCNNSYMEPSDIVLNMTFPDGITSKAGVNIRPFCREMLRELHKDCEIVVFTASHKDYMEPILNWIDPNNELIDYRMHRESCVRHYGMFLKDLRIIKNRDLSQLVLIDNAAYSFCMQITNGIPCVPYYKGQFDTELRDLIPFLKSLYNVRDVRKVVDKHFQLKKLKNASTAFQGLLSLFEH